MQLFRRPRKPPLLGYCEKDLELGQVHDLFPG
jgi:hypothetical protein